MPDGGTCRIFAEVLTGFPIASRANRPTTKISAAVRADIFQNMDDAGTAKSTFERANHRIPGIGRERRITVLAGWSEFEHKKDLSVFSVEILLVFNITTREALGSDQRWESNDVAKELYVQAARRWLAWVTAAPARSEAATMAASTNSVSLAPAVRALLRWIWMQ